MYLCVILLILAHLHQCNTDPHFAEWNTWITFAASFLYSFDVQRTSDSASSYKESPIGAFLIRVKVFTDLLVSHFSPGVCSILLEFATLYLAILHLTCFGNWPYRQCCQIKRSCCLSAKGVPIITTGCLKSRENGNHIYRVCIFWWHQLAVHRLYSSLFRNLR